MGMREEYHLGTLFKARYLETGFMDISYDRSQVRHCMMCHTHLNSSIIRYTYAALISIGH